MFQDSRATKTLRERPQSNKTAAGNRLQQGGAVAEVGPTQESTEAEAAADSQIQKHSILGRQHDGFPLSLPILGKQ